MEIRSSACILPRGPQAERPKSTVPWADLPKELQGGFKTIQRSDFGVKTYDKTSHHLTSEELKNRWISELKRRKASEDEKLYASWRAESRLQDEILDKRFQPVDTVTTFNYAGKIMRSASAPLEEFQARLDHISEREHKRRAAVPSPVPTEFTPPPHLAEDFNVTYWYPADKQRLKFRIMEEARLASSRLDLMDQGWAPECPPGGADKRGGSPDRIRLSPEDEQRVNEQLERMRREAEERDDATTMEEKGKLPAAFERHFLAEAGVAVPPDPSKPVFSQELVDELNMLRERAAPFKPPQVYRAELPSSRLPLRLELPKGSASSAPAPPWGRQTEEEDRWKKKAEYALEELRKQEESVLRSGSSRAVAAGNGGARRSLLRPIEKGDVDRELKVVRDGGLLKRPRQSVAKSIGADTLAFVRSLPKDFGKSSGARAMLPVPIPGAASLK